MGFAPAALLAAFFGHDSAASDVVAAPILLQTAHSSPVLALAASTDQKFMLSGDLAGNVKLWNISTGRAVAEYQFGSNAGIAAAEFHPEHPEIVALSIGRSGEEGTIALFDLTRGIKTHSWSGYASHLAFSSDGRYLAGKESSDVSVWVVETGRLFVRLAGAKGRGIGFRDATTLAFRDSMGIRLLDLRDGSTEALLRSEDGGNFTMFAGGGVGSWSCAKGPQCFGTLIANASCVKQN